MLKWLAPTARSNWDEVSAKWSTLSQQIEGVKRTRQWNGEQIKLALFSYQRENPGPRWFGLSKKMGVGRSKGDEGGGAMGYFNLICKIWDYKINDQTKMHAESSISCGRSHFTTTSLPLTMRSWLDRDLWGSPTVCKSGRSRSTASSDCTTKDRCWWTRRGLQGFAICTTSRITQTVSFCNWTRTDEVALNKIHLKNLFSVYLFHSYCNKPTTINYGTQTAVGVYTRWGEICAVAHFVYFVLSKCYVEKLLHLWGFCLIWNAFTFNVVILQLCVISNSLKNPVEVAVDPGIHPRHIPLATGSWSKADNSDQLRPESFAKSVVWNFDFAHQTASAVSKAGISSSNSSSTKLFLLQGCALVLVRLLTSVLLKYRHLQELKNICWTSSVFQGGPPACYLYDCFVASKGVQGVVLMVVPPGEADWLHKLVVLRLAVQLDQCNVVPVLPGLVVLGMEDDLLDTKVLNRGAPWTVYICA